MAAKTLKDFNREYLNVHVAKEDLFWTTYMGVEPDSSKLERAESAYKAYISDPVRIQEARTALSGANSSAERSALEGWLRYFETHSIESEEGRRRQAELIEMESRLFEKRTQLKLHYRNSAGEQIQGSTNVMASNIAASADEVVRKTSHEALLELEQWVLRTSGYLELVRKRNAFARSLGYKTYYEYRVNKLERMSADHLFAILDEFEELTRDRCFREFKRLGAEKGPSALLGHNVRFAMAGDVERDMDPFLPFDRSLERWALSFSRMGIRYRGATLHLDLFDRKGKYENGFMHAPQPCFYDDGRWQPARIGFTSNATPNQVGSGRRGLMTFFHEGGHAAHFSNITMNSPCFSQEFPPTSMAYAETQSMFCDSVTNDADWIALYARNRRGQPVPEETLRSFVTQNHPWAAFQARMILVVPVFERRLYALSDEDLTPENVTALARRCEKEILGLDCSPRPLLAIPHLLSSDSSCSYQGYLLAEMGVAQTRAHFFKKYGYIVDNPRIGEDLARHYWNPGNSKTHDETMASLTGEGLSGRELATHCNLDGERLWAEAHERMTSALKRAQDRTASDNLESAALDASIFIVHGAEKIADNQQSMRRMCDDFAAWIAAKFPMG